MSNFAQRIKNKIKENKGIDSYEDRYSEAQSEIYKAIKTKDYRLALEIALEVMPTPARTKFVCEIFYGGKYRAYSLGMKNFKKEIDYYLETKDKTKLLSFYESISKTPSITIGDTFTAVRCDIIDAILSQERYFLLVNTLQHLLGITYQEDMQDDSDKKYRKLLFEICSILYPQNQGFKVLFV